MEGGEAKIAAVVARLVRRGGKDGIFKKRCLTTCCNFTSPLSLLD